MAAAGVVVAAALDPGRIASVGKVALAAASAIALTVTANAWNDAADAAIDRQAHPGRPIPSGRVTAASARRLALAAGAVGIGLAALAAPALGALSVLVVMLMLGYSPALKRSGLSGNVTVALLASLPFYYGAWVTDAPEVGAILTGWAFTLHFAREIAKDIDDAPADAGHRRTVPLRFGPRAARRLAIFALLLFVAPFVLLLAVVPEAVAAMAPAIALIAVGAARIVRGRPGAPRALKAAMFFAMLGLLADRLILF